MTAKHTWTIRLRTNKTINVDADSSGFTSCDGSPILYLTSDGNTVALFPAEIVASMVRDNPQD